MAQFDTQYTTLPEPAPRRRLWPLAGVMLIDLVVMLIALVILMTVISAIFIFVRMAQQGTNLIGPGGINQDQLLRLIGPDGVFVTLLVQNAVFVTVPMLRVALLRR